MRKPKTVEITLRVRVPAGMSVAWARMEVTGAWYGEVYALMPDGRDVSLFPRWGKARLIKASTPPWTPEDAAKRRPPEGFNPALKDPANG